MIGTQASVAMLTKLIIDNEVTGLEADMWMTTLAFIPNPSKDIVKEVLVSPTTNLCTHILQFMNIDKYHKFLSILQPLLRRKDIALLSISALVNAYCRSSTCENDMDIVNITSHMESQIGNGCNVDEKSKENVILYLHF